MACIEELSKQRQRQRQCEREWRRPPAAQVETDAARQTHTILPWSPQRRLCCPGGPRRYSRWTLHTSKSSGNAKLLVGNLESVYCGGAETKPFDEDSDGCSMHPARTPRNHFASTYIIKINSASMGLGQNQMPSPSGATTTCVWLVHCLDGMQTPIKG